MVSVLHQKSWLMIGQRHWQKGEKSWMILTSINIFNECKSHLNQKTGAGNPPFRSKGINFKRINFTTKLGICSSTCSTSVELSLHKAHIVNTFFHQKLMKYHETTVHSPDLFVCKWFFFSKNLNCQLSYTALGRQIPIKKNSPKELEEILLMAFKKCFDDWIYCWHVFITLNKNHYKGDQNKNIWFNNYFVFYETIPDT